MGYISKDIAVITEPDIVTLSAVPNFVQFASKPASKTYLEVDIQVNALPGTKYTTWDTPNGFYNVDVPNYSDAFVASGEWVCMSINVSGGDTFLVSSYIRNNAGSLALVQFYTDGVLSGYLERGNHSQGIEYNNYRFTVPNGVNLTVIHCYRSNVNIASILKENNIYATSVLRITEPSGVVHTFRGSSDAENVSTRVYFVSTETSDTAENLRQALLSDKWVNANFEITIPFVWQGGNSQNGSILNIKSKGAGSDFNATISAPSNIDDAAYTINWVNPVPRNNDSISGEASTVEIDLDIYTDPDVFLGQDDRPITPDRLGTYVTTLQKTYAGSPVWFELNALFSQYGGYNRPSGTSGWFDTGTSRTYRFTAKVKAINSFYFYQSNALYVLNGYGPASEDLDLSQYVYNENTIKLLTDKPRTPYIRGQKEYLNFIFSDPQRGVSQPINFTLRIAYRVYSTSDNYLGTIYGQEKGRADFTIVNTCQLDMDTVLDQYPTAGIIRVSLARGTALVSNDLEYTVRPECLHTLRQFSFINRLGGWDTFNFDAGIKDEIKPSVETYNKTLTPSYQKGDSIETVYNTTLANTFTIEGAPVTDDVAAWLKELAAARVILDNDGNYIIIEDFTLQVTGTNKNMQKPTIKYRLSE